jgi:dTDP-4-dehydrorhamnose reductase
LSSPERVLITGASGQLGTDLAAALDGDAEVVALDHAALDITEEGAVAEALAAARPQVVFNCAAFHNVEACEAEEATAADVNVRAVKRLAQACREHGTQLVHFSTNYVFDGREPDPYVESDLPAPRSVYAITKLAGEHAALAYCPNGLVVRSAGLYGEAGSASKGGNFVERMIGRARAGEGIKMVSDQRLTPTFTPDLAAGTLDAVGSGTTGILHLTNGGACSWYEFTCAILDGAGIDVEVTPVETSIPPGGADRPLNGVLESEVAGAHGLEPLRPWRDALGAYLGRLT